MVHSNNAEPIFVWLNEFDLSLCVFLTTNSQWTFWDICWKTHTDSTHSVDACETAHTGYCLTSQDFMLFLFALLPAPLRLRSSGVKLLRIQQLSNKLQSLELEISQSLTGITGD